MKMPLRKWLRYGHSCSVPWWIWWAASAPCLALGWILLQGPVKWHGRVDAAIWITAGGVLLAVALVQGMSRWFTRVRAIERQAQNRCQGCGYDLTGNVSGVCPECGTAVQEHDAGGNESVPTKEED